MMPGGGIWFRHYTITVHAIDRFVERCELPAGEIIPALNSAVLAQVERARKPGIRRVIRSAEERGGYVLFNGKCYFIITPDRETGRHIVATVMSPRYM